MCLHPQSLPEMVTLVAHTSMLPHCVPHFYLNSFNWIRLKFSVSPSFNNNTIEFWTRPSIVVAALWLLSIFQFYCLHKRRGVFLTTPTLKNTFLFLSSLSLSRHLYLCEWLCKIPKGTTARSNAQKFVLNTCKRSWHPRSIVNKKFLLDVLKKKSKIWEICN